MVVTSFNELEIFPVIKGANQYSKVSYPLRYGHYSEIRRREYIYQFNLNGEIKFITGRGPEWPDPSEWLKRTVSNDWLYYSSGGYSGTKEYSGEYYVPCTQYTSNSILLSNPFDNENVRAAIRSYDILYEKIKALKTDENDSETRIFLDKVRKWPQEALKKKSSGLRKILGDRITVLPPDARHVDYEVIPIVIADGCLYKCSFCALKSPKKYSVRSDKDIKNQILELKQFYGEDIKNYNSLFLAQHDALNAGIDLIEQTAHNAINEFGLAGSNIKGLNLFLFGSIGSLMKMDEPFIKRLNNISCKTYINIGLESADPKTLRYIKKDITAPDVEASFTRMLEMNRRYENVELTSNFLFGDRLPENHYPSIFRLIEKHVSRTQWKGAVYFSPLVGNDRDEIRSTKRKFYDIKRRLKIPCFLYLIQRL